jgi:antitoxin HicB
MRYDIVIQADEDGVFVAGCVTLPGCVSQGTNPAVALANLSDAMHGYLASLRRRCEAAPAPRSDPT